MSKLRPRVPFGQHTKTVLRTTLLGVTAAQAAAVVAVHAVDTVRKARIPGGVHGFPALPPADTVVEDSVVRSYTEGTSLYADMLSAIRSAKKHVYFETYVWRADKVGQAFKDALYEAADRGVKVFIVYDGFGTLNQSPLFKIFPKHPNLFVHRLAEIRLGVLLLNARRTGRTHRKLLIVDDRVGFVGGFNIGEDFGREWRDTHVRVTGPGVEELSNGFVDFWNHFRPRNAPELSPQFIKRWRPPISAAFNLPSRLLFPVRGLYLDAFEKSTKQILITTAYFIPDKEILAELTAASRRGVQVKVLIPEYSNHIMADWVARPFYGELLKAGVEIWLYQHAMVHSKTMTVDGVWSTVGTANIDRLSLMGNFEINLQLYSPDFAARMEDIFENDLTTSRRLTFEEWEGRSLLAKTGEVLLQSFNPLV